MRDDQGNLGRTFEACATGECTADVSVAARIASGLWLAAVVAVNGAAGAVGGVLARWQQRRRRLAALRELNALSDMMLKDIGLDRGQIPEIAARMAARGDWPMRRGRYG